MYKIAIIDIGIGNIFSLCQAIKKVGGEPIVIKGPVCLSKVDGIILPGVGTFQYAACRLSEENLDVWIKESIKLGKSFLGICLGMQLLFSGSQEGGEYTKGLEIFEGDCIQIASPCLKNLKLPNMGWRKIQFSSPESRYCEFNNKRFYFMHSYQVMTSEKLDELAVSLYHDVKINSLVRKKNIIGAQFHPEKSGDNGLKLLKSFLVNIRSNVIGSESINAVERI